MLRLVLGLLLLSAAAHEVSAKVYWLPDFLQDNTSRGNELPENGSVPGGSENDKTCAAYGMLSAAQISAQGFNASDCDTRSFPDTGTCYTNCKCSASFKYTSANCSGYRVPSGSSCNGKYSDCLCDTSQFPYTSCPPGYVHKSGSPLCADTLLHISECVDACDGLTDYDCGNFDCKKLIINAHQNVRSAIPTTAISETIIMALITARNTGTTAPQNARPSVNAAKPVYQTPAPASH